MLLTGVLLDRKSLQCVVAVAAAVAAVTAVVLQQAM
jgi:hypothetical protein